MKILVVDDEAPARARLSRLIEELDAGHAVVGEAADGDEALAFCAEVPVDLVLLDVQMPGMDGLECAARLAELDPPPAVILVTAYTRYALAAFAHQVRDYLVKPVRRERLAAALARLPITTRPQRQALGLAETTTAPPRRHLSARYRGGLKRVPLEEIHYLFAEQKYVTVHYDGGELLLDDSLKALEDEFPGRFLRIHRNTLVARDRVTGLERTLDGTTLVTLRGCPERLQVSRRHLPEVRRWMRAGVPD
jgi:two-component system response regulator AlgR